MRICKKKMIKIKNIKNYHNYVEKSFLSYPLIIKLRYFYFLILKN